MKSSEYIPRIVLIFAFLCGCKAFTFAPKPTAMPDVPIETIIPSPTLNPAFPPVSGAEPSYRVAAFYYPWYRTPEVDGYWDHWGDGSLVPPLDIASDFYPTLGAYSIADAAVLAQHFAWLREARVGTIISSWWGIGSREDRAVPLLLDMAERYGIKVAFHIEPYSGRSASQLISDITYIHENYGDHPAFFRTTDSSRWSKDSRPKGLFYLWASRFPYMDVPAVEPEYWREAIDRIHELPDGALVLSDQNDSEWVDGGHFDGLYNYGVLDVYLDQGYSWARGLPPGAWYVPGINPGFSGQRIGLDDELITPRRDGATYDDRWERALSTGVEPKLVTITTFNEWHEGTQIEPAAVDFSNGKGQPYEDYGSLSPEGYLTLTREWVNKFLNRTWPETTPLRIRVSTTSDWTTFSLISGASWSQPERISVSEEARDAGMQGDSFILTQPIDRAEAGGTVEMTFDMLFSDWESGGTVVFRIERGDIGATQVEFSRHVGDELVVIDEFNWGGIVGGGRNAHDIKIPADELFGATP